MEIMSITENSPDCVNLFQSTMIESPEMFILIYFSEYMFYDA